MIKTLTTAISASLLAFACASSPPILENIKTDLSKPNFHDISRRLPRYINSQKLKSLLTSNTEVVIIFGARWCRDCKLINEAINHIETDIEVYYVNVDKPWAMKLANAMNIRSIPAMFHTNKNGKTLATRVGPESIISYLVMVHQGFIKKW